VRDSKLSSDGGHRERLVAALSELPFGDIENLLDLLLTLERLDSPAGT
jgi:hypothetical protein